MTHFLAYGKGVVVVHRDDLVVDLSVQHVGDEARADALDLVGAGDAGGQHGGGLGLHGDYLDGGVLFLQELTGAGDGTAGAHAGHEEVHLAVGVGPDLGTGGLIVGLGVGGIDELACHEAVGDLLGQLVGLGDGALHALGTLGEHQLGAVGLHQLAALHGHGLGHDDDDAVAPGGGHGGQADAGVAGGGLNDDGARLQQALGLGVVDHGLGDTVLDAAGGVEVLQLGDDLRLEVMGLFDMGQLQQGSLADQLVSRSVNVRHSVYLLYRL